MEGFLVIGFITGLLFGFVLQRGSFCMYTGFANMVITKDYRVIKATIWAFLLTMIGFHAMHSLGIMTLEPKPFFWLASVVGALLFSIGMVLAGGCIVGTPLKAASGKMGYWVTLLGMASGGWLVIWGPLASFRKEVLQNATKVMLKGKNPTLDALLGINHWVVVVIVASILIWLLTKLKGGVSSQEEKNVSLDKKIFTKLWPPVAIGIGLAIVEMIAYASGKSPSGLGGFIKGYGFYFRSLLTGKLPFGWPVTEVTGIIVGVFITAVIAKEFRIIWPKFTQIPRMYFGGFFMGIGAVIAAGGCNIAHLLSHVTQFSIGSIVSGTIIIITTLFLVRFIFVRGKSSR